MVGRAIVTVDHKSAASVRIRSLARRQMATIGPLPPGSSKNAPMVHSPQESVLPPLSTRHQGNLGLYRDRCIRFQPVCHRGTVFRLIADMSRPSEFPYFLAPTPSGIALGCQFLLDRDSEDECGYDAHHERHYRCDDYAMTTPLVLEVDRAAGLGEMRSEPGC